MRKVLEDFSDYFDDVELLEVMKKIQKDFKEDVYELGSLYTKFTSFAKENMSFEDIINSLIKAASELTSKDAPKWEYIAGRFFKF